MGNLLTTLVKPGRMTPGQEIDLWYALHASLAAFCAKLDADVAVTGTNYTALCFTAIINCSVENSAGSVVKNFITTKPEHFHTVRPTGISDKARLDMMYNFTSAISTLCAKLDADTGVADTDYADLCYTAIHTYRIVQPETGQELGVATNYTFNYASAHNPNLVEWFHKMFTCLTTLAAKLDADGTVTGEDYNDICYVAICTMTIESAAGVVVGN